MVVVASWQRDKVDASKERESPLLAKHMQNVFGFDAEVAMVKEKVVIQNSGHPSYQPWLYPRGGSVSS